MLAACRGAAEAAGIDYPQLVYPYLEKQMSLAIPITTSELCRLAEVSRAGFYRWKAQAPSADPDMELRDEIQRIALEFSYYGSRRVTRESHERGWLVNRKKVQRLMREDNLLCLRKRRFIVTTDSNHALPVYPNVAPEMVLTGIDQLWRSDITYVRLETEFVYLAVVLDAFSRKVVGWALDRTLEATLTIEALQMALRTRKPAAGLVHHSDRGVQYASGDYTDLLKAHGIQISMSPPRQSLRQCPVRVAHEDAQVRRSLSQRIPGSGRGPRPDRRVPGQGLQPKTLALGAGLPASDQIRSATDDEEHGGGCAATGRMSFLRHQRSFRPMGKNKPGGGLAPTPGSHRLG
jgi:putative transposase